MEGYLSAHSVQVWSNDGPSHHVLTYSGNAVIVHCSLFYLSPAFCNQLRVRWEIQSMSMLCNPWKKSYTEKGLWAKMKRITAGLPVFWLVDGEYDSWRGGLLLDGGQEGKLTFTPEQLYHFFCDVCRGVNCSPNIWRNKMKWKEIMSSCQLFSQPMCRLASSVCTWQKHKWHIKWANHTWWNTK